MSKKSNRKRLNEHQRCEIISKLSKMNAPSKRALAQEYNVSEGAIRRVWDIREAILKQFALLYEEAKERTFQASVGQFTELEDMLYIWIDSMRRAKLLVRSSLAIAKAKSIASNLSILESESFQSKIQTVDLKAKRKKLQNLRQMMIHDMFN
jgi:hypothetical protein